MAGMELRQPVEDFLSLLKHSRTLSTLFYSGLVDMQIMGTQRPTEIVKMIVRVIRSSIHPVEKGKGLNRVLNSTPPDIYIVPRTNPFRFFSRRSGLPI